MAAPKRTEHTADTAPLKEGNFGFLDPKRLAAQEKRWRYRPCKPKGASTTSTPKWSLRVPLDDGRDCYGAANDYYPDEWGSGDYRKSRVSFQWRVGHLGACSPMRCARHSLMRPLRSSSPRCLDSVLATPRS